MITLRKVALQVIGKQIKTVGWIWTTQKYLIVLYLVDKSASVSSKNSNSLAEIELESFVEYCQFHIGEMVLMTMYSPDNRHWFFSEEDAEANIT